MSRVALALVAVVVSFMVVPCGVSAQIRTPLTSATAFPVSIASPGSAASTSINPSALGTLDSWSLTYSHVDPLEGSPYADRVDALWAATRVSAGFALGLGPEFLRSRTPGLPDTNGFVLAAALSGGPSWSLGANWRFRSPRDGGPNVHTADVALSVRPSNTLALSVIGRDLSVEKPYLGELFLRRAGVLALALRPLGDDRLTLELSGAADEGGDLGLRAMGSAYVPWVGQLAVSGERSEVAGEEVWTLVGGVDVRWGGLSAAPAMMTSDDFERRSWSLMVDVQGKPRPGVPTQRYVAKVPIDGLGPRALINTLLRLDRALHDPRIAGVVLAPTDTGAALATAQEMRLMIQTLERAGKPVYCYLEAASGSEMYMCAAARRVAIDPAGLVRLMGISSESLYFGELLRDVGIRADFVRIGRYKSAPEAYTNSAPSEAARQERTALLDDGYRRLVSDLAGDLEQDEAAVRALIDRGPFLPQEALSARLVQAEVDRREIEDDARETFGARTHIAEQGSRALAHRFGPTGQIGVVVVDGTIVDGENVDIPFVDVHMTGGRTVSDTIDELADNPRIRAIVLRVDSPGGAVMASDQIWRAVRRAQKRKPVIASMGNVAASGGYYVASAADEIWADPSTITGSIGIFYGKVDFAPVAARFGVGIETDKRGAHAGADSVFRPFTDEERAALSGKIRIWYKQFLERVAEGRNMPIERVDALARGRVYSGDAAKPLGLVDSLGGFGAALMRARELAKLPDRAEVVVVPRRPSSLLEYVFRGGGAQGAANQLPEALKPFFAQLATLARFSGTTPMALYEGPTSLH